MSLHEEMKNWPSYRTKKLVVDDLVINKNEVLHGFKCRIGGAQWFVRLKLTWTTYSHHNASRWTELNKLLANYMKVCCLGWHFVVLKDSSDEGRRCLICLQIEK